MKLLNSIFKIALIVFVCLYGYRNFILPEYKLFKYSDEYMDLTLKCAHAMDSNWYIEQGFSQGLKKSSEIELLECHYYDKMRKMLLDSGISEYKLSELGLIALEIHQKPAEELAIYHKFRER